MSTKYPYKKNISPHSCFDLLESPFAIDVDRVSRSVESYKEQDSCVDFKGGSLKDPYVYLPEERTNISEYADSGKNREQYPDQTTVRPSPTVNRTYQNDMENDAYNKVLEDESLSSQHNQDYHSRRHDYQAPEVDLQLQYILQTIFQDGFHDSSADDMEMKAKRKRASPEQLRILNLVFQHTFFPSTELRNQLARHLRMSPRAVQIWFQNKRQSWKLSKHKRIDDGEPATRSPSPYPSGPKRNISPTVSGTSSRQLPSFSEITNFNMQMNLNSIHISSEVSGEEKYQATLHNSEKARRSQPYIAALPVLPPLQQALIQSPCESQLPQLPSINHIIQRDFTLP
ncbi:hypothetical protein K7432_008440 [Basidiobolus ranarum]|uniref:Homeobox domain-containing protein n=1 Tax=Basidiobolus ranarum TaxID=34480 RepID=A0ABR2WRS7_9FUNG